MTTTSDIAPAAPTPTAPPPAGRREWLGLAVLALPTLLMSLDISVLYLALPTLSAELGADGTQQLWILDSYGFMIAGFLVTMGGLGDRIGRRRLLLIGATAFSIASVAAAYAPDPTTLIATRAVLGVAAATLMPSTLALISTMFRDERQRGIAISAWMSCFMAGAAIGPVVGGALLEHFWWGSAFLLGVPVMVLLLLTGPALLPEHRTSRIAGSRARIDLVSVALSLGAILPLVYGIKEIARDGVAPAPAAAILTGGLVGLAFVHRQHRLADPLIDLSLFRRGGFTAALAIGVVSGAVMGGTVLLVTQYLQQVLGLSPLRTGLAEVPQAVAMAAGSLYAPSMAARFGTVRVMTGGLLTSAAGLALLAVAPVVGALLSDSAAGSVAGGLLTAVAALTLIHAGLGPAMALAVGMVLAAAPREKAGAASAISETSGELGIALGVAVFGSAGVALYRSGLVDAAPTGTPHEVLSAARESLAAARTVAQPLPGTLGADLLHAAHQAFAGGLTVIAALGAVLFVGLAALTAHRLRATA